MPPDRSQNGNGNGATRASLKAELEDRIRRIEGVGQRRDRAVVPLGVEAVDAHLPWGGLPTACVHEVAGSALTGAGAATGFCAVLLSRLAAEGADKAGQARPVLWLEQGDDLYMPGLVRYGLSAEQLFLVSRLRKGTDCLWAMEQALRCPALAAVIAEVDAVSLTAGRRLQLAAEEGGVSGLVLARPSATRAGSPAGAFVTRWQVAAQPSLSEDGLPGVGAPAWQVDLTHCRSGRPGSWSLLWREEPGCLEHIDEDHESEADGQAALPSLRIVG
ncbi:MAG: hypothetical protein R3360_00535 [Alphaproteobacteria bacterium]|nr:hypothetical protein [Alphaproteobacteria bacterium]